MRFSTFHTPITPSPEADTAVIDDLIERIFILDEGGFACTYLPEHHFDDYTTYSNPFMLASFLAPQMKQAYVGFSIAVVPMHHPARLAEMANLLDQLTKGRFVFGIGGGGIPLESAGFGIHTADMKDIHDEVFESVLELWAKKPEDPPVQIKVRDLYEGTVYQRIMPSAYSPGGPRVKLAVSSPDRIDKAARYGWSAFMFGPMLGMFRQKLEENGHSPERIEEILEWTSGSATVHVAETEADARAELLEAMASRNTWAIGQFALNETTVNTWMRLKAERLGAVDGNDEEALLANTIYGTPEQVIDKLRPFADMGYREMLLQMDHGVFTPSVMGASRRSMQLFCDEVVPYFDAYQPDLAAGEAAAAEMQERMRATMAARMAAAASDDAPGGAAPVRA